MDHAKYPVIVKEVGQGFGPASLNALMKMPLAAIEFGAFGGTNFSILELTRNEKAQSLQPLANIGHRAEEMISFVNAILMKNSPCSCNSFIVSGGVTSFLDGYHHLQKINATAVYGQASEMLKYALEGYEQLSNFIEKQKEGLALAKAFLRIKEDEGK